MCAHKYTLKFKKVKQKFFRIWKESSQKYKGHQDGASPDGLMCLQCPDYFTSIIFLVSTKVPPDLPAVSL